MFISKTNSLVSHIHQVQAAGTYQNNLVSTTTQDKLLRNKIAQALVERIKRAHKKGEKYKVFILIPLIPAFEGDLATKDAAAARNVMHFQYITISRGGNSIIEKLREAGIEPSDYIGWYSLRNWDKLVPPLSNKKQQQQQSRKGSPSPSTTPPTKSVDTSSATTSIDPSSFASAATTDLPDDPSPSATPVPSSSEKSIWDDDDREHYVSELVYIHDKILIVDDRIVLIGSGN
jgi:phosphatidylserine/phosphatidylglycerophosphate/cardiolipin synthase-like enzyme